MTNEADYSFEEWKLLIQTPLRVSDVVIGAGRSSPAQVAQELFALNSIVAETDRLGVANRLIRTVADSLKDHAVGVEEAQSLEVEAQADPEGVRSRALESLRQAAALIRQKSSPEEGAEFSRWLMAIAQTVAEASKEGGFLGFGGVVVSEQETAALREIEAALSAS